MALRGNNLATVFIIPKRKSYLICERQVVLFVLLLFVRLLFEFLHHQLTEALRRDKLVPVARSIKLDGHESARISSALYDTSRHIHK